MSEVAIGLAWTALDHLRHHRTVLTDLVRLFRQDWENWDKTGCLCDEVGGDIKYDVRERRWIHRRCGGRLNNGEIECT